MTRGQVGGHLHRARLRGEGRGRQDRGREALGAPARPRPRRRPRPHRRVASGRTTAGTIAWRRSATASSTAGSDFAAPDAHRRRRSWPSWRRSCRWRRCTSPTTWRRSAPCSPAPPELPQVACFDTAMHRDHPAGRADVRAARGAGRRRASAATASTACRTSTSPALLPRFDAARGARARRWCSTSATAPACARSRAGRSIASTMGFTGVDGLPMGTRSRRPRSRRDALPDGRSAAWTRARSRS